MMTGWGALFVGGQVSVFQRKKPAKKELVEQTIELIEI